MRHAATQGRIWQNSTAMEACSSFRGILEAVLRAGARAAEPGEFTRRAFLNGKMDLTQAEAVMDVIRASTSVALRAAEEQLSGRLGREVEEIRVISSGSWLMWKLTSIFLKKGSSPTPARSCWPTIGQVRDRIESLLGDRRRRAEFSAKVSASFSAASRMPGNRACSIGLLGFERAIVSASPGTTRDTIEEFASLRGIPFRITDTAVYEKARCH